MSKIRIQDNVTTNFVAIEKEGVTITGCAFIDCVYSKVECKNCNITSRGLAGRTIPLDKIEDLIVSE